MTLAAALSAAILVYLVVGLLVGVRPEWESRRVSAPSRAERLATWLEQADAHITRRSLGLVVMMSAAVPAAMVLVSTGVASLGLMVGLLGACAPIVVLDRRRVANRRVRRAAWPDALRDLATRLRSGASMHAALTELGRLGPAPLRPSFARYETLAAALDHRVALETIGNELADPLTDRIVEVLLVAFDQGSRVVVDVLEELAASTVRDLALTTDIETAQLETKLEARSAAVLPFVVLGLLCLGSEGYRNFYASGRGTLVIVFGFVMSLVGVVLVDRLGRIEVEPRILRAGGGQR